MKTLLSLIFLFLLSAAAYGQNCTYAVTPFQVVLPPTGGTVTVRVDTQAACVWSVVNTSDWVTMEGGTETANDGSFTLTVPASPDGRQRFHSFTVAGQPYAVVQEGIPCNTTITATPNPVPAAGCLLTVNVTKSHPDCYVRGTNVFAEWLQYSQIFPKIPAAYARDGLDITSRPRSAAASV